MHQDGVCELGPRKKVLKHYQRGRVEVTLGDSKAKTWQFHNSEKRVLPPKRGMTFPGAGVRPNTKKTEAYLLTLR